MVTAVAEQLDPELVGRLRRLKLRRIREVAGEVCLTARTQRWRPEELLRVLVAEECKAGGGRRVGLLSARLGGRQPPLPAGRRRLRDPERGAHLELGLRAVDELLTRRHQRHRHPGQAPASLRGGDPGRALLPAPRGQSASEARNGPRKREDAVTLRMWTAPRDL